MSFQDVKEQVKNAKQLIADNQRYHAKCWLDAHGYDFGWKDTKEGLVLVRVNERTMLAERPDEALDKKQYRELRCYVRARSMEDARLKRARRLDRIDADA